MGLKFMSSLTAVALAVSLSIIPAGVASAADATGASSAQTTADGTTGTAGSAAKNDESSRFRTGSAYLRWLDQNVAVTDNKSTNTFLEVLVDFLLGAGILAVFSAIYGEIVRQFPI